MDHGVGFCGIGGNRKTWSAGLAIARGGPPASYPHLKRNAFSRGLLVRQTGDIVALSPPLIVERSHIDQMFGTLAEVVRSQR